MSSTLRKGTSLYNSRSLKRNVELRALLSYIGKNPDTNLVTIAYKFGWSHAKSRNSVENLKNIEFLYASSKTHVKAKSYAHNYSICAYTESDLQEKLPIERPSHLPPPRPTVRSTQGVPRPAVSVRMRRDPMVEMLMGVGRAPSLNFIDSLKGVSDVKPKAAYSTH